MLKGQTVFVVGAGASSEFDLPVGTTLALRISDKLNIQYNHLGSDIIVGDRDLFLNVCKHSQAVDQNAQAWQKAAWLIRDGIILAHSIDDFLDAHQHDKRVVELGKAAIARCILEAESSSTLFFDPNARSLIPGRPPTIDMRKCADSWLAGLMRLLVRGLPHGDRGKIFDRCSFVVFNYDRCVEHFFLHALQRFYNIEAGEAAEIVGRARIYHPYGMAGKLDALGGAGGHSSFGTARADYYSIGNTALKTYTETIESKDIRNVVREAARLVFLGFAFHDQNMSMLVDGQNLDMKPIVGTALGMSDSDINAVRQQMGGWVEPNLKHLMTTKIELGGELKAADIFRFYSKSL